MQEEKPKRVRRTKEVQKAISPMNQPDRFKLGESGYIGTNLFAGVTQDEVKKELNFPYSIKTFKQMSYHSTVNAALTLYEAMVSKANWKVNPPRNATAEELKQTEFIESCMKDMEHSWVDFIKDVLSMQTFGFSLHEKVYRKRYYSNGSLYDDGLIGWKKLPIRSQETIVKFLQSEDGNDIIGVQQDANRVHDPYLSNATSNSVVNIPASKIMLFRAGRHRGDPYGKSPLRDAYLAWRYLIALEEIEAIGVSKDLSGTPVLYIPPQYMQADATTEQKAIYEYYKAAMRNFQNTQQTSMILPQTYDVETKTPLFKLELLTNNGTKNFDTTKVKEYYKNLILTSLFADVLVMGQSNTGSYALGSIKTTLIGNAVESMLKSIKEVINKDLVRQTYELNGWDKARACEIDYDDLERNDLEALSKFIQRTASVGLVVKDVETVNRIRQAMGVDNVEMTDDEVRELLTPETSRASDGMAKGSGNGTSDNVSGNDNSSLNLDNSA